MGGEGSPAVLISGESGAGKTEAAKKVLEYIAAVSKVCSLFFFASTFLFVNVCLQEGAGVAQIKQMLLDSNPILEAFGNAKTLRNDNSSRFGKYMEIAFDFAGAPQGGRVTNFLLEKVRVVSRNEGERSFHIFYQMLSGLSDQEIGAITGGVRNCDDFAFLQKSKCHTVPGMNDKQEFKRVRDAMKSLGMAPESQLQVFRLLSAILFLGNVEFVAPQKDKDKSAVKNKDVVQKVANLLKVGWLLIVCCVCLIWCEGQTW
jgi:myosin-1